MVHVVIAVAHPISVNFAYTMAASGASGLLSNLIVNGDIASNQIQSTLNKSTASSFKLSITYTKKTRGQDKWYEASSASITPAR